MEERLKPGLTYEVALHARPEQFLDWDKPLSGQSAALKEAFSKAHPANAPPIHPEHPLPNQQLGIALSNDHLKIAKDAAAETLKQQGIPGIRYLDQDSRPMFDKWRIAQERADNWSKEGHPSATKAQQYADELKGNITSNYVVWSPEIIEILRKYGLVGSAGAGASLANVLAEDRQ